MSLPLDTAAPIYGPGTAPAAAPSAAPSTAALGLPPSAPPSAPPTPTQLRAGPITPATQPIRVLVPEQAPVVEPAREDAHATAPATTRSHARSRRHWEPPGGWLPFDPLVPFTKGRRAMDWLRRRPAIPICLTAAIVVTVVAATALVVSHTVTRMPDTLVAQVPASAAVAPTTSPNTVPTEVGLRFTSSLSGVVLGVRYYRGRGNAGPHQGSLWSGTGELLARTTFTDETETGWQQALFDRPVPLRAERAYVVSYTAPHGRYSFQLQAHAAPRTRAKLSMPANAGVYGPKGQFPRKSWRSADFLVDVLLQLHPNPSTPRVAAAPAASPAVTPTPKPLATTLGCLRAPSACGFPDASTTGPARSDAAALTPYTGPMSITKPGTVIEGKAIPAGLTIKASDVVIRRSAVVFRTATCTGLCAGLEVEDQASKVVLEDISIAGDPAPCRVGAVLNGVDATVRRADIHGCDAGIWAGQGALVADSYLHDLKHRATLPGVVLHDGVRLLAGSVRLDHNTIIETDGPAINSATALTLPSEVVVQRSLLNGGKCTVLVHPLGTAYQLLGNRFGHDHPDRPVCGLATQYTWVGNLWDDNGSAA